MSYRGVGQAGQHLISTQTGPRGSWSNVTSTTVASGIPADFTSIEQALANNKQNLFVIGDVHEVGNLDINGSGVSIVIQNNALVNLGTNKFVLDGSLDINGNGRLRYAHTVQDVVFDGTSLATLDVDGIRIINGSSVESSLSDVTTARLSRCIIDGDLVVDGDRVLISTCSINGNLVIKASASGCNIQHCSTQNISDSGVDTILANIDLV